MNGKYKEYFIKNLGQFQKLFIDFDKYVDKELYIGFNSFNNLEILVFSEDKYESKLSWNIETPATEETSKITYPTVE